ncbi:MAG: DUF6036 family nucleotidyltransferase, partial [Candidatus Binatia bacterium]
MNEADRTVVAALAALRAALSEIGAPHMLIGGTAVILRGVARVTDDLDATVWAERLEIGDVLATLMRHGIVARIPDAEEFARTRHVLLLRHDETGTPVDLSLAWLPFEQDALARAEIIEIEHVQMPVALAQDLVVYKAVAWRDRDRTDIERLMRAHAREIDFAYVRRMVREFADALGEPERVEEFERLLARVSGQR